MGRRGPRIDRFLGQDLDRLEALSDGVFAFAMTLLAFDIRVPDPISITSEERLWAALVALAPRLVTYAMSFLTLGIFWNAQQAHLHHLRGSDRTFTWVQLTFLGVIVAIPFSTELLAEFITFRVALLVYWANIFIAGITLAWSLWHMRRAALLRDGRAEVVTLLRRRLIVAQLLYFFGATLCVFSTYWSISFIFAVQLYYTTGVRLPVVSGSMIGRS
jgi:uncharacterized membrane protein